MPVGRGRRGVRAEAAADPVEGDGDVLVLVGVDADDDVGPLEVETGHEGRGLDGRPRAPPGGQDCDEISGRDQAPIKSQRRRAGGQKDPRARRPTRQRKDTSVNQKWGQAVPPEGARDRASARSQSSVRCSMPSSFGSFLHDMAQLLARFQQNVVFIKALQSRASSNRRSTPNTRHQPRRDRWQGTRFGRRLRRTAGGR